MDSHVIVACHLTGDGKLFAVDPVIEGGRVSRLVVDAVPRRSGMAARRF